MANDSPDRFAETVTVTMLHTGNTGLNKLTLQSSLTYLDRSPKSTIRFQNATHLTRLVELGEWYCIDLSLSLPTPPRKGLNVVSCFESGSDSHCLR